jgi:hypothetical protein
MLVSAVMRAKHGGNSGVASPSTSIMSRISPAEASSEGHLLMIIDQQNHAISLLHDAFAAERQVWGMEKERLYQRIANLERLLKSGNHHRLVLGRPSGWYCTWVLS